jgi:hypothetical protein
MMGLGLAEQAAPLRPGARVASSKRALQGPLHFHMSGQGQDVAMDACLRR